MKSSDLLANWVSVKNFRDERVEEETLERIFEMTTAAPTAFNLQPYRFIVLESEEAFEKALDCLNPMNGWVESADRIVVLVGYEDIDRNADRTLARQVESGEIERKEAEELREMFKSYMKRDNEFLTGWLTRNTVIPASFFMLACRTEGIGCCPVRGFDQHCISDSLDLEESEQPILLIPIGYPEEGEERSWRRDPEEIYTSV